MATRFSRARAKDDRVSRHPGREGSAAAVEYCVNGCAVDEHQEDGCGVREHVSRLSTV
jgi:hypothetical protein